MKGLSRFLLLFCVMASFCLQVRADEGILYTSDQLSSPLISCIAQDQQGYIWVGTQNGLNRFDGYRFTPYLYNKDTPHSLCHNNVTALHVDTDGQLWVGTAKGLARYRAATDDFEHFDMRPDSDDEPRITNIVESPTGKILVGTSGFGLFEVDRHETDIRQINRYSADDANDYYWALFFDSQGRFWKSGNNGIIYCFSADTQPRLLLKYQPTTSLTFSIFGDTKAHIMAISRQGGVVFDAVTLAHTELHTNLATLNSAILGTDGNLFLGTTGYGLWHYGLFDQPREPVAVTNSNIDFSTVNVTALFEDRQHNLWVGCNQRGLLFSPNRQQAFQNWSLASRGVKSARVIESLAPASDGGLWAALGDGDLYHFDATGHITRTINCPSRLHFIHRDHSGNYWAGIGRSLYSFHEASGRLQEVKTFDGDFLYTMADDARGHLYLSTFAAGMVIYDPSTGAMRYYDMYMQDDPRGYLCNNWIFAFHIDAHGLLWIATSSGVSCYDPAKDTFKTFGWHNILEGYACISLAEDQDGNILIGTDRGLFLFDRQRNETQLFHGAEELQDKTIQAITCQPNGDVWMSTSMGIWHYSRSSGQLFSHINDNGLRERVYNSGVGLRMENGNIIFGNSDGLVAFHPDHVAVTQQQPGEIHLSSLRIGGQPVNAQTLSNGDIITTAPVSQSSHFALSYLDNSFTMEFTTFDYADARDMVLEYCLNDGPYTANASGNNVISFSHLQPGSYRLYVRAEQNGQYSDTKTYTLTIRAPWYRSTTARVLYVLLVLLVLSYLSWRYYRNRRQQMAEEKMQFLINATHDIRTPLTLILSPLHKAMNIVKTEGAANAKLSTLNTQLETIDHNAHRILALVNQILDIRKIDKQQMRLQCEETSLVPYIQQICKVFEPHAQERNITFRFEHPEEVTAWIDHVQFDKVIQNLLSNAFKFTPDGGVIELRVESLELKVILTVTDTGTGLREADIPKLFTRFYQSASNQALGKEGTGIGLNLCKMIVEMHHGTITARNRQDGQKGSQFIVSLPQGCDHLRSEEMKPISENPQPILTHPEPASDAAGGTTKSTGRRPHILLVDDDAEITDYVAGELGALYRCGIAHNGKEALSMLLTDGDDPYELVVSDIMMPEMDGFMLLRTIKSNLSLQHLPVILLTSESAVGNRLEGLQQGADAFMAKPFIIEELNSQIGNLLRKASVAKHRETLQEEREKVEQREVADNDKQLMERIVQSVNKNLGDSEYSVEQLASDAGLSRSQLHRKMKELTGISPSEFIRNLRLEQAARLLKERKVNVSQVAYTLGFNSLGTFSKVFKQHFGQTPTEFIGEIRNNK